MLGIGLTYPAMVPATTLSSGGELMEDATMSSMGNMESLAQRFDSALHLTGSNMSPQQAQGQIVSGSSSSSSARYPNYSYCGPQTAQPPQMLPRRSSALILPPPPSPDLSLPHVRGVSSTSECPSVHLLSDDGHSQIPLRALSTSGRPSAKSSSHARASASDLPIAELLRLLFPLASSSASARTMSTNANPRRRDRSITPPSHFVHGSCAPPSSPILTSSLCYPSALAPTNAPPNSPLSLTPAFAASAVDMDNQDVRMSGSSSPTRGFSDDMMAMDLGPPSISHPATASSPFPPHPPTPPTPTPTVSDLHLAMSQYNLPVPNLTSYLSGCGFMSSSAGLESPVMSHAMGNSMMMHLPASPPLSPKCVSATPKTKRKPVVATVASPPTTSTSTSSVSHRAKSHYHSKRKLSGTRSSSSGTALAVLSGVSTASTSSISKRTAAAASSASSSSAPNGAEKVRQQRRVRAMVKNLARQLDGLSMD
ncbi:hypothetical protein BCR44DRAFT_57312 [Catenaria anguillulae PL171]|uniref:Uncharacterized protein n=1 Tax=Catenaria anguillulae PL171 TaxID=765915 RepID=A0A1Y2I626_9FUNG|nr:hypothetical protein BCR44DRAFT_57312 [Catenaria anguillulae PL171]